MTEIKSAYLAGAMTGLEDHGNTWREEAIKMTPAGWRFINPSELEHDKIIPLNLINGDLSVLLSCHAVLAKIDEKSWGTAMEICHATQHHILVIGFGKLPRPASIWLLAHVDFLYDTLEEAINAYPFTFQGR